MTAVNTLIVQKITVGINPKDGLTYSVGKPAYKDGHAISMIEEIEKGIEYNVYLKTPAGMVMWKTFRNVPVSVHYDVEGYVGSSN